MTEIMGQSCFELITVKFVKKRQPFELITVTKWSPEYVLGNLLWKLCACQSAALHWVTTAKISFKLSSNFPLSDAWVFHPLCYWVPRQGLERFPEITPPIPKMFEDFKGWKKKWRFPERIHVEQSRMPVSYRNIDCFGTTPTTQLHGFRHKH